MASLLAALKIDSKGPTTVEDYEKQFDLIAEKLLNECCLQINERPHRFVEIEFYYTNAIHADPFTHKDKDQMTCGQWYFHKIGAQYKGGTYKGLDITCGSVTAHGGILIRGIQDMQTGEFKDGSCVCVDHILQQNNVDSIKDLTSLKKFNFQVTSGSTNCIVDNINLPKLEIVKSARVGLNMKKKEDNQTEYVMKPYRYLSSPAYTKKGKIHVALTLHMQGKSATEIQRITGSPLTSIQNWISLYQKGYNTNITEYVNKALDNESLCTAMGAWAKQYYKATTSTVNNNAPQAVVIASTIEDLSKLVTANLQSNLPQFRSMFNALRMQLNSYNKDDAAQALLVFRKFLSLETTVAPMQEVYEADLIPKFVDFLRETENPTFVVDAAWTLSNIACSTNFNHIHAIFDADVFVPVMQLLSSSKEEVYDQALWLIANLLGYIHNVENEKIVMQYRKKFIEMGIIPVICQLGFAEQKPAVAANVAWALDNVLRGAEFVSQSQALSVLPCLAKLINVSHPEATSYGAMAIARLTAKHDETLIQRVIDIDGMAGRLVALLDTVDLDTKNNASKALANMTAGTPTQVLALVQRGLAQNLTMVFNDTTANPKKVLIENIAKILEHVTLAADESLLGMITGSGIFGIGQMAPTIKKMHNYIWALSNATFAANEQQLDYFIGQELHKQLAAALSDSTADRELTIAILEGLANFFKRGPKVAKSVPEVKKWSQMLTSNDPEIQGLRARLEKLSS